MSELPTVLITDILSRLPVKSLLRFRSVSKPWCSLIDGPDFIKIHLNRSLDTNSNLTLILGGMGTLYSLDCDSLDKAIEFDCPFNNFDALGSYNGLVLLQSDKIVIFNPSTREFRYLPATPVEYPDGIVSSAFETYGFGYDTKNDDYKVIRVNEFRNVCHEWIHSEAKVYSLKLNSWKKIRDFPYCVPYKRVWGVHVKGALHTIVAKNRSPDSPNVIVAFDFGNEGCYLIAQPDFAYEDEFEMTVEVMGGCLCLLVAFEGSRRDIWIMKDYGVKESWVKLLTIAPPMVQPYLTVYPLVYSKCGGKVLLNYDDKSFLWYDLRRKNVRKVRVRGLPPPPFYAEVCVGSLVRLNGYGKKVGIKKQHGPEKTKEMKNKKKRDGFLSEGFKLVL